MENKPIPNAGEIAPNFQVADSTGREWSLVESVAGGPRIFLFYRGHW